MLAEYYTWKWWHDVVNDLLAAVSYRRSAALQHMKDCTHNNSCRSPCQSDIANWQLTWQRMRVHSVHWRPCYNRCSISLTKSTTLSIITQLARSLWVCVPTKAQKRQSVSYTAVLDLVKSLTILSTDCTAFYPHNGTMSLDSEYVTSNFQLGRPHFLTVTVMWMLFNTLDLHH